MRLHNIARQAAYGGGIIHEITVSIIRAETSQKPVKRLSCINQEAYGVSLNIALVKLTSFNR